VNTRVRVRRAVESRPSSLSALRLVTRPVPLTTRGVLVEDALWSFRTVPLVVRVIALIVFALLDLPSRKL
jgi:hypothetical protein